MLSLYKVEQIHALSQKGLSNVAIGKKLGCHPDTVKFYIQPEVRARRTERIVELRRQRKERAVKAGIILSVEKRIVSFQDLRNQLVETRLLLAREALFDPLRDPKPKFAESFSEALGDPPIGRRELLEQWAKEHPDPHPAYAERPKCTTCPKSPNGSGSELTSTAPTTLPISKPQASPTASTPTPTMSEASLDRAAA